METLVTLGLLTLILVIVAQVVSTVSQSWKKGAIDSWGPAEEAFAQLTNDLSNATLEPYNDYVDAGGRSGQGIVPDHLARRSDLTFVCGPHLLAGNRLTCGDGVFFLTQRGYSQTEAHLGLDHCLNGEGYEVEFGNDQGPMTSQPSWRWRLKQILQPSENLAIFNTATSASFIQALVPSGVAEPTLAENIVTLLIIPERAANDNGSALAPNFTYDSRDASNPLNHHQLPPRIRLVLVAMDEASALLLANRYGTSAPPLVDAKLFQRVDELAADLATLDTQLTGLKIDHRIYERDLLLTAAAWTEVASP